MHTPWFDNRKAPNTPFIDQTYDEEQAVGLFIDLLTYFRNPRYIKIEGRPLLLIWAPERNPKINLYAEIIHTLGSRHGIEPPFIAGVEAYLAAPPKLFGLEAMVEFAPDWRVENHVSLPGEKPVRIDYQKTLNFMLAKPRPDYLRLRCTFPSWDNTPRRGFEGIACVGVNPQGFSEALQKLSVYTQTFLPESLQYVFLNAWNEWGEGCHLEPDERYGLTYLQIIKSISREFSKA
ncbi:MAG: glycoside hydrolase family 99-like domain-containing protein [Desulfovibrionaceae bacterium]|nr:glycoside hydrolase family 99-like domain-containing protein [Desulfovibrionaceae bacterium]